MLTDIAVELLEYLLDGKEHAWVELVMALNQDNALLLSAAELLMQYDIAVVFDKDSCRLTDLPSLLSVSKINSFLLPDYRHQINLINVCLSTESTNAQAMTSDPGDGFNVFVTELQTSGRGRRGKSWRAPFASNLLMSVACQFPYPLQQLTTLSLWSAIACHDAIKSIGVSDIGLKWPNDIYVAGKKVAGILLEAKRLPDGRNRLIIGMGINCNQMDGMGIDQPWTSIKLALGGDVDRAHLAAAVLMQLVDSFSRAFKSPEQLIQFWQQRDLHLGQQVSISAIDGVTFVGRHDGISVDGRIRLLTDTGMRYFNAGEVSLRGTV